MRALRSTAVSGEDRRRGGGGKERKADVKVQVSPIRKREGHTSEGGAGEDPHNGGGLRGEIVQIPVKQRVESKIRHCCWKEKKRKNKRLFFSNF